MLAVTLVVTALIVVTSTVAVGIILPLFLAAWRTSRVTVSLVVTTCLYVAIHVTPLVPNI
jgi:hypothetical protein